MSIAATKAAFDAATAALNDARRAEERARLAYHQALSDDWLCRARAQAPVAANDVEEVQTTGLGGRGLVTRRRLYRLLGQQGKGLLIRTITQDPSGIWEFGAPIERQYIGIMQREHESTLRGNTRECRDMARKFGVTS